MTHTTNRNPTWQGLHFEEFVEFLHSCGEAVKLGSAEDTTGVQACRYHIDVTYLLWFYGVFWCHPQPKGTYRTP